MRGCSWKPSELLILVSYNQKGYHDQAVYQILLTHGKDRSLAGVRSKLYELRKYPAAFDRKSWTWREELFEVLRREADEEKKDKDKEYDLLW
jgi:hypothetical protein